MKSSVETLSDTSVKLTVEIPFDELQDSVKEAYRSIAAQVNVPGFRRGKVPARIIDQRFGRGAVLEEVVNKRVPMAYEEAVTEAGLQVMGQPEVEVTKIEDGDLIEFTANVEVVPEFDLPPYEGLEVEVSSSEVNDAAVDEQVDELRARFATVTPVERSAQSDDLVLVDISGAVDGEEVEDFGGNGLTFELGSDTLIEGFTEAVVGASEGDTVTFTFTPDDGQHAGEEVALTVVVKGVRERTLPTADDDFAMLASEFDTLDDLRADLRGKLEGSRVAEQAYEAREKLLEALLAQVDFPLPDRYLESQVDDHFADGHGDDEHRAEVRAESEQSLRTQLVLDKIADEEQLSVEQGELIQWLMQQAPRYGMTVEQFANALAEAGQVTTAMSDVRRGKAMALVLRKALVSDAEGNSVDLGRLDSDDDSADEETTGEEPAGVGEASEEESAGSQPAAEAPESAGQGVEATESVVESGRA